MSTTEHLLTDKIYVLGNGTSTSIIFGFIELNFYSYVNHVFFFNNIVKFISL